MVGHTGCKVAKKLIPLYNKLYFVADFGNIGVFRSCSVGVFTFDDTQGKFSLVGHTGREIAQKVNSQYNKLWELPKNGKSGIAICSCMVVASLMIIPKGKFSLVGVGSGGLC